MIYAPDLSFFFGNGLVKARQFGITVPIYSTYIAELPVARTLVPDVYYSFPGELTGAQGAVAELSKQAAEIAVNTVEKCANKVTCLKKELSTSGKFDTNGVYKRQIVLKQIKNSEPVMVK